MQGLETAAPVGSGARLGVGRWWERRRGRRLAVMAAGIFGLTGLPAGCASTIEPTLGPVAAFSARAGPGDSRVVTPLDALTVEEGAEVTIRPLLFVGRLADADPDEPLDEAVRLQAVLRLVRSDGGYLQWPLVGESGGVDSVRLRRYRHDARYAQQLGGYALGPVSLRDVEALEVCISEVNGAAHDVVRAGAAVHALPEPRVTDPAVLDTVTRRGRDAGGRIELAVRLPVLDEPAVADEEQPAEREIWLVLVEAEPDADGTTETDAAKLDRVARLLIPERDGVSALRDKTGAVVPRTTVVVLSIRISRGLPGELRQQPRRRPPEDEDERFKEPPPRAVALGGGAGPAGGR